MSGHVLRPTRRCRQAHFHLRQLLKRQNRLQQIQCLMQNSNFQKFPEYRLWLHQNLLRLRYRPKPNKRPEKY
jgi:hypothetical protein